MFVFVFDIRTDFVLIFEFLFCLVIDNFFWGGIGGLLCFSGVFFYNQDKIIHYHYIMIYLCYNVKLNECYSYLQQRGDSKGDVELLSKYAPFFFFFKFLLIITG